MVEACFWLLDTEYGLVLIDTIETWTESTPVQTSFGTVISMSVPEPGESVTF